MVFSEFHQHLDVADKAKLLGWELWGYGPTGVLRVSRPGATTPSNGRTHESIEAAFDAVFKRIPYRAGSRLFRVALIDPVALCPVCGENVAVVDRTADRRLIAECGDAFWPEQWAMEPIDA